MWKNNSSYISKYENNEIPLEPLIDIKQNIMEDYIQEEHLDYSPRDEQYPSHDPNYGF